MFKVGQKVTVDHDDYRDSVLKIIAHDKRKTWPYKLKVIDQRNGKYGVGHTVDWRDEGDTFIYKGNKSNMSIIEKIKLFGKGEPEKSNIVAGLRTVEGEFTEDGKDAFLEFLYQKNATEFKTEIADKLIAEDKKND